MKPDFPPLATILFLGITAYLFVITVLGLAHALNENRHPNYKSVLYLVVLALLGWLFATMALSLSGFFARFDRMPPPVLLTVALAFVTIAVLASSRRFMNTVAAVPPAWLIWPQAFRVLMEVVLWLLFLDGIVPEQMTFEGLNFDIVAGATAPFAAWLAFGAGRRNIGLAIVWNIVSLALLVNILTIAVLSMPALDLFEGKNTFVAHWPFIWLPAFVAPYAAFLHVISLRQLFAMRKNLRAA